MLVFHEEKFLLFNLGEELYSQITLSFEKREAISSLTQTQNDGKNCHR
jgi:hypothetical protein